ncbi:MAG: CBS domain-containing protein [Betaproteobacteria bacterium]|nr:CBS domain-containing protein [Betaproteobacteria bacterium]
MARTTYAPVPFALLKPGTAFHSPAQKLPEQVSLESPAADVMTDLKQVGAVVIRPDDTVDEAQRRMIQRGVRSLLVLGHDRKVTGLVTATDILGEKPMKVIAQRACTRDEILVSDIMTPQGRLEVMDMDNVRTAKVGNIVATLQASGRQHAMVVDRDPEGRETLRGLFSSTQIARQLGMAIQTLETARTFAEIESLLAF